MHTNVLIVFKDDQFITVIQIFLYKTLDKIISESKIAKKKLLYKTLNSVP